MFFFCFLQIFSQLYPQLKKIFFSHFFEENFTFFKFKFMNISKIAQLIGESVTLKLNETVGILQKQGEPVIHLGGGEPKSKAPLSAILAATAKINSAEVRYTPADGITELKQAIVRYTDDFYRRKVDLQNVLASSGAKQALMMAIQTLLNPSDEVIILVPYWVSYPSMVQMCGAVPVFVRAADGSFFPTMSEIIQKITPKTKAIIINSPNNPTGLLYPESFIAEMVQYCEKNDIYLFIDDIYHRLIFDNKRPISCFDYTDVATDNSKLILINGVSKQYAMTGFRIGWAVANRELIKIMAKLQGHQTSGPSVVLQVAAAAALTGIEPSVESLRINLENNRDILMAQLKTFDGIKVVKPDGTFYCFVDFRKYDADSMRLSQFLIDKVRVVTVPGIDFGMEGFLRISFCGTAKDIIDGIARIKWALEPDSPKELFIGDKKIIKTW